MIKNKKFKNPFLLIWGILCACLCVFNGCIFDEEQKSDDEVDFSKLNWTFGGIDASGATTTEGLKIANLNFTPKYMTYNFEKGNLSLWGYSDKDASARACLFYKDTDGVWRGGFFEWISTSRTSREYDNIKGKYKGWNWNSIPNGAEGAFLIIDKSGTKRTNVIKGQWQK